MTTLTRRALARLPLTEAEVEAFYATEFGHRRPVRDILESHERLRAELQGSAELHSESAAALRGAAAEVAATRLTWTTDAPTRPGWYWLRSPGGSVVRVREVVGGDGEPLALIDGHGQPWPLPEHYAGYSFAGPIPQPEG